MITSKLIRLLHTGNPCWGSTNKTLLGKLRKKTGYTFSNCKKALELNNNDFEKAEKWLQEQAQALGWSKATKLEGRPTSQGLVAVAVESNTATLVEVNCETDFVARNKNFQSMVEAVAAACLRFANTQPVVSPLTKMGLDSERLKCLPADDGKPLIDHVALHIGNLGENLSLKRAICFRASPGTLLAGYTHPASLNKSGTEFGKYGALVAFKDLISDGSSRAPDQLPVAQLGRQLCQHVVGMHPSKIGDPEEDSPTENPDDENCMIYQEYLLDPTQTVQQILATSNISLIDFVRFECGEEVETVMQVPLQDLAVEVGG